MKLEILEFPMFFSANFLSYTGKLTAVVKSASAGKLNSTLAQYCMWLFLFELQPNEPSNDPSLDVFKKKETS